jgi:hypothetical protein
MNLRPILLLAGVVACAADGPVEPTPQRPDTVTVTVRDTVTLPPDTVTIPPDTVTVPEAVHPVDTTYAMNLQDNRAAINPDIRRIDGNFTPSAVVDVLAVYTATEWRSDGSARNLTDILITDVSFCVDGAQPPECDMAVTSSNGQSEYPWIIPATLGQHVLVGYARTPDGTLVSGTGVILTVGPPPPPPPPPPGDTTYAVRSNMPEPLTIHWLQATDGTYRAYIGSGTTTPGQYNWSGQLLKLVDGEIADSIPMELIWRQYPVVYHTLPTAHNFQVFEWTGAANPLPAIVTQETSDTARWTYGIPAFNFYRTVQVVP